MSLLSRLESLFEGIFEGGPRRLLRPQLQPIEITHALDRACIPYFVSEFEENMTSFEHLAIQLETFVENLLFD